MLLLLPDSSPDAPEHQVNPTQHDKLDDLISILMYKQQYQQQYLGNKKAQLTQGLRATAPSFQDGRQPPSWTLSNWK